MNRETERSLAKVFPLKDSKSMDICGRRYVLCPEYSECTMDY